ncbi:FAD-dependent oxidoreductase [Desulfurella sp.]|uniref:FAD-dependent oxidoreductase n=1 Tax=Desulfurella sp. TaxID=1962857 RepID=UPI003D0B3715
MEPTKIVVIGADAAGASAASQAKRRQKDAHVIMLEKTQDVSYGACGMPYIIGLKKDMEEVISLSAKEIREKRNIDLRLNEEAIGIDTKKRVVLVKNNLSNHQYELNYDKLIIATGAKSNLPPINGITNEGVFSLKSLEDGRKLNKYLISENCKKAVLIGGGFINLELADNLKKRGLEVVILEKLDNILLEYTDEIRQKAIEELQNNGVKLICSVDIEKIDSPLKVITNKGTFECDVVNVSTGFKPNTDFLIGSALNFFSNNAIDVDQKMKTNIEDVFACGDCAAIYHKILKKNIYFPLGTNANKQGRIAGINATDGNEVFEGITGTSVFKLFDLGIAKTGLSLKQAQEAGFEPKITTIVANEKAHYLPNNKEIIVSLISDIKTKQLLGAQICSYDGILRINALSVAIYANLKVSEVKYLDFAYSPPYSAVWDAVLICATQADK